MSAIRTLRPSSRATEEQEQIVVSFATSSADPASDGWGHMGGWGGGWMWLWAVAMMFLFAALLIALARTFDRTPNPPTGDSSGRAKEILAERYANGDLSTEEYRERTNELG